MATKAKTTTRKPDSKVVPLSNDISAQLEQLKADFAALAKTVSEQTKATVADKTSAVTDAAAEKKVAAKAQYDELTTKAEAHVKENPLTSLAIAVGAGVILGALSRR